MTRCMNTASQWHLSVLTLKSLFQAHCDLHENKPLEESWKAAFAQARAQRIFFPGVNFFFWCELRTRSYSLETPHVHDFNIAMKHGKQLLALQHKGRQAMHELRNKLSAASKVKKRRWEAQMRRRQKLLLAYILSCELCNRRSFPQTPVHTRRRLTGKQPATSYLETTVQFTVPLPATEDMQTGVHASNSVRKRKFLCVTDAS